MGSALRVGFSLSVDACIGCGFALLYVAPIGLIIFVGGALSVIIATKRHQLRDSTT
jgi:hypothetical protein